MDCKERLFDSVILKMGDCLDKEQIERLKVVLSVELNKYNIEDMEERDLLSVYSGKNERLIQQFVVAKKIEGLSKTTLKAYTYTLHRFIDMFDVDLLQVDTNMLRMFLYRLESLGDTEATMDNYRRNINSFYGWLVEEEYILRNPVAKIRPIKGEKKIKKPYSDIEITKIKDNCHTFKHKAIIDVLLTTGIRNSELCGIKLEDVDFYDKTILIHGKGNKQRIVYLSDGCLLHIEQYLDERKANGIESEYLFCNDRKKMIDGVWKHTAMSNENLRKIIKQIGFKADVIDNYPHRFRRTFGCSMLNYADISIVQQLMGHADISATKIYVTASDNRLRYEHDKLRMPA